MATNSGRSYVKCYHPTIDDEWCEIKVKWTHYKYVGDRYSPPEDSVEIDDEVLISYNDEPAPKDAPIPDWVTLDDLLQGIDLEDFDEPDYDDYYD